MGTENEQYSGEGRGDCAGRNYFLPISETFVRKEDNMQT